MKFKAGMCMCVTFLTKLALRRKLVCCIIVQYFKIISARDLSKLFIGYFTLRIGFSQTIITNQEIMTIISSQQGFIKSDHVLPPHKRLESGSLDFATGACILNRWWDPVSINHQRSLNSTLRVLTGEG